MGITTSMLGLQWCKYFTTTDKKKVTNIVVVLKTNKQTKICVEPAQVARLSKVLSNLSCPTADHFGADHAPFACSGADPKYGFGNGLENWNQFSSLNRCSLNKTNQLQPEAASLQPIQLCLFWAASRLERYTVCRPLTSVSPIKQFQHSNVVRLVLQLSTLFYWPFTDDPT